MPELPGVETIRRSIEPQIMGCEIHKVEIFNRQVIAYLETDEFVKLLSRQQFSGISRRGKFLIFEFVNGDKMFLHLRMTGQILVTPCDYPVEKHTHLVIHLDNEKQIRYIDVRRFGRFWYIEKGKPESTTGIYKLGLETFDKFLTASYLKYKLAGKKKAIKEMVVNATIKM